MRAPIGLVLAAAIAGVLMAVPVRAEDSRDPGAQTNVRQSEEYERLLCTNAAFRKTRIEKECGPINDPAMHQQCVDSFACDKKHIDHSRDVPPSER